MSFFRPKASTVSNLPVTVVTVFSSVITVSFVWVKIMFSISNSFHAIDFISNFWAENAILVVLSSPLIKR